MATIKVRVQGEIATNLTPEVKLVCQNDKYDVEFEFDESWANSNFKTALFIYNGKSVPIPFDREQNRNVCKIPALYDTELLHIGVKSDDIGGLHTSTPARVGCLLSANDIANGEIPNPTPNQYDEIIALLNQYITGGGSGEGVDLRDYQKKVDESLETESKQVSGAINEVNSGLVKGINSSITEETNELVLELKGKDGTVLFSTKVQLPKSELPDLSAFVKASDFLEGEGAPTTATVAPFVGALYLDTTNNNTYQCTAIDKATPSYTWVKLIRETDYATEGKTGVVKNYYNKLTSGIEFLSDGSIRINKADNGDIDAKTSETMPIVPKNQDHAWKVSATTNTEEWTDDDKAKACDTIGAFPNIQTDIAGDCLVPIYNPNKDQYGMKRAYGSYIGKNAFVMRDDNGLIYGSTPTSESKDNTLTTREYVDNLPDYLTLTDEQKAKWRAWLGIE